MNLLTCEGVEGLVVGRIDLQPTRWSPDLVGVGRCEQIDGTGVQLQRPSAGDV